MGSGPVNGAAETSPKIPLWRPPLSKRLHTLRSDRLPSHTKRLLDAISTPRGRWHAPDPRDRPLGCFGCSGTRRKCCRHCCKRGIASSDDPHSPQSLLHAAAYLPSLTRARLSTHRCSRRFRLSITPWPWCWQPALLGRRGASVESRHLHVQLCRGPTRLFLPLVALACWKQTQEQRTSLPMQHGSNPQLREWLAGPGVMASSVDAGCSRRQGPSVVELSSGTTPGSPPPQLDPN